MKIISKIIIIFLLMAFPIKDYAQKFSNFHWLEVWWVATHPFIAKKTWKISEQSREIANSYIKSNELDGDYNGGMVDAFRHTLWMASLVQEIKPKAAYKLGLAHEKGNKADFDKKLLEEGKLPDSTSCEMDLRNNYVGIEIGQEYYGESLDTLILVVKNAVKTGRCWKIKKDSLGNFLDQNGNFIPESQWKGKWITPKVLVPSDFPRPKMQKN
ncbi:MAG: hypothetical protein JXL97_18060 [Bacteroidales bacterium]|nr:hypothetical protein [Bacteroidales bacterium]